MNGHRSISHDFWKSFDSFWLIFFIFAALFRPSILPFHKKFMSTAFHSFRVAFDAATNPTQFISAFDALQMKEQFQLKIQHFNIDSNHHSPLDCHNFRCACTTSYSVPSFVVSIRHSVSSIDWVVSSFSVRFSAHFHRNIPVSLDSDLRLVPFSPPTFGYVCRVPCECTVDKSTVANVNCNQLRLHRHHLPSSRRMQRCHRGMERISHTIDQHSNGIQLAYVMWQPNAGCLHCISNSICKERKKKKTNFKWLCKRAVWMHR